MMYRNVPQNGPHRSENSGRKRLNCNEIRPTGRSTIASILSHKCTVFAYANAETSVTIGGSA